MPIKSRWSRISMFQFHLDSKWIKSIFIQDWSTNTLSYECSNAAHTELNRQDWRPSCHTETLSGNIQKQGWLGGPWPLLSWWGIQASLGPQSQGPLSLSHSYQPLQCWDPGRERKREREITKAQEQRTTGRRETVTCFQIIPLRQNKRIFICFLRLVDWLRETKWVEYGIIFHYGLTPDTGKRCASELQPSTPFERLLRLHVLIYIRRQTRVLNLFLGGKFRILRGKQQRYKLNYDNLNTPLVFLHK